MVIRLVKTICFLGVDGSGKSTLVKKVSDELLSRGTDAHTYYFGWQPFLPMTRLLSRLFRRRKYHITEDFNKSNKFSILKECTLVYFFIEYIARYVSVRLNNLSASFIIFDRYFYDIYAHYSYAERSVLFPLLLWLFPRPQYIYFLDVPVDIAHRRKPEMNPETIEAHHNRYLALAQKLKARIISTDKLVHVTVSTIMEGIE